MTGQPSDPAQPASGSRRPAATSPVGPAVLYTLLRILVFFGVLSVLWLAGLRSQDDRILLLALSLVGSMVVSFFLLRPFREEMSARIAQRVDQRRAAEADEE